MNLIEKVLRSNYTLWLWSDAPHDIDISPIKRLLDLVAQRLDFYLKISAFYHDFERRWQIRCRWRNEQDSWSGCDHAMDNSELACARDMFIDRLAHDIGERIKKLAVPEDQSWFIEKYDSRINVRVYQLTRRILLRANTVTHNRDFALQESLEIVVQTRSLDVSIRGNSIEIDGMLLQAELLEMLTIGDDCHIRFCVNPLSNQIIYSPDELNVQFFTSTRTARLASWGRIRRMVEDGQIEFPRRSGYFDQYLMGYLERPERARIEMPCQQPSAEITFTEPSGTSFQEFLGPLEVAREAIALPVLSAEQLGVAVNRVHPQGIGDVTCKYSANSRMLRCAVNPCGPCEGCSHYEKI